MHKKKEIRIMEPYTFSVAMHRGRCSVGGWKDSSLRVTGYLKKQKETQNDSNSG